MVEAADAQKVRARSELEKLHKGLVIGIEGKTVSKPIFADQSSDNLNTVDVPLAIDMVREALGTLDGLKDLVARQQAELEGTERDNLRLRNELSAAQKRVSDLQSQIAVVKLESQDLQNSLVEHEEERQKLQERQVKTEDNLKALVGVVVTSFRESLRKEAPKKN